MNPEAGPQKGLYSTGTNSPRYSTETSGVSNQPATDQKVHMCPLEPAHKETVEGTAPANNTGAQPGNTDTNHIAEEAPPEPPITAGAPSETSARNIPAEGAQTHTADRLSDQPADNRAEQAPNHTQLDHGHQALNITARHTPHPNQAERDQDPEKKEADNTGHWMTIQ